MNAVYVLLFSMILLVGCFDIPDDRQPVENDTIVNDSVQPPVPPVNDTPTIEEELAEEFNCDMGVYEETTFEELTIWTCERNNLPFEEQEIYDYGIYQLDAHPMGFIAVTYILYDGNEYVEIEEPDQLTPYFAPIETEHEAVVYTYLHEGLNMVTNIGHMPEAGTTSAEKLDDGFSVTVLYEGWNLCPCYGGVMKSIYNLTENGEIEENNFEVVYSWQEDCIC